MGDKLSPTMQDAITIATANGGKLTRYPGGFWCRSGLNTHEHPWFGTTTIQALVSRGVFAYSQWFEGGRSRFPVEVTLAAATQTDSGEGR